MQTMETKKTIEEQDGKTRHSKRIPRTSKIRRQTRNSIQQRNSKQKTTRSSKEERRKAQRISEEAMKPVIFFGKQVGYITIDKRFIGFRRPEHYFIKFQGFGMSTALLTQLKRQDVHTITIIYTKKDASQTKFTTPINKFYEEGEKYTDRENDTQLILHLNHFKREVQK